MKYFSTPREQTYTYTQTMDGFRQHLDAEHYRILLPLLKGEQEEIKLIRPDSSKRAELHQICGAIGLITKSVPIPGPSGAGGNTRFRRRGVEKDMYIKRPPNFEWSNSMISKINLCYGKQKRFKHDHEDGFIDECNNCGHRYLVSKVEYDTNDYIECPHCYENTKHIGSPNSEEELYE